MAVYLALDQAEIQNIVRVFSRLGELKSFEGVAAGSINTMYRLTTSEGDFYMRITRDRPLKDLVYEKDVLVHLASRHERLGFSAPRLLRSDAAGFFFPLDDHHMVMIFEALSGRELGVFELQDDHCRQIGAALARTHDVLDSFPARRKNPYGRDQVETWISALAATRLSAEVTQALEAAFSSLRRRESALRATVVHGDAFLNNTKWKRNNLASLFDWEMAGDDVALVDIAVALCAWCYERTANRFVKTRARALVDGYASVRALNDAERAQLHSETRLAALRFTVTRINDFEIGDAPAGPRQYLDYRDYLARYDALQEWGPDGFVEDIFS